MKKFLSTVCILVMCSAVLFATGGKESALKTPVIRFAHQAVASSENTKPIYDLIETYAVKVADKYTLVQEAVVNDELKSKIRIDMASNNMPDVLWYWGAPSDAKQLVDAGLVLDVDEFFAASNLDREDFKDLWDAVSVGGKNFCIPIDNLISSWVVNKTLFDKYGLENPKTYNDLIELAKTFNKNGIITLGIGSKGGNPSNWIIDMVNSQYAGYREPMLAMGTTYQLDATNMKKTLNVFQSLIDGKVLPADTIANGDWGPYWALFTSGKAAVSWAWAGMISSLKDADFEWELINPPQVDGTGYDTSNTEYGYSGAGIMINKKSFQDPAKRDAIIDFVEFYCGEEMQLMQLYANGVIPTRKNLTVDESKVNPIVMNMLTQSEGKEIYLTHLSTIPDSSVWVDYESGLDEFFAQTMNADQFIKYVQNSFDENNPNK